MCIFPQLVCEFTKLLTKTKPKIKTYMNNRSNQLLFIALNINIIFFILNKTQII